MTEEELTRLKYPIGTFTCPQIITAQHIATWTDEIAQFPARISKLTAQLSADQKSWTYRPGGWNIKQLVHHCADSHLHSLIRFKWALSEDQPTIKAYDENEWIKLAGADDEELCDSLTLLQGLHARWVGLLNRLTEEELNRSFFHPEHKRLFTLKETIGGYAWHCAQHLAHIEQALEAKGKYN